MTRILRVPLGLACGSAAAGALASLPKCPACLTAYATTYLVAGAGLGLALAATADVRGVRRPRRPAREPAAHPENYPAAQREVQPAAQREA